MKKSILVFVISSFGFFSALNGNGIELESTDYSNIEVQEDAFEAVEELKKATIESKERLCDYKKGNFESSGCMTDCNKKCCKKVLGIPVCEPACKTTCWQANQICKNILKKVEKKAFQLAREGKDAGTFDNQTDCRIIVTAGLAAWGASQGGGPWGAAAGGASGAAFSRMACRAVFP